MSFEFKINTPIFVSHFENGQINFIYLTKN